MIPGLPALTRRAGGPLREARGRAGSLFHGGAWLAGNMAGAVGAVVDTGASLAVNVAGVTGEAFGAAGNVVTAPLRAVAKARGPAAASDRGELWTLEWRRILDILRGHTRSVWLGSGRAHIQLSQGVVEDQGLVDRLESALTEFAGVRWARVNPLLRRVVVAFDPDEVTVGELTGAVDQVDEAWREVRADPDAPPHPGDLRPLLRQLVAVGVDIASLGLTVAGRLANLPALPTGAVMLMSLVEYSPRLRVVVESRLGAPVADVTLSVLNSLVQALGQGVMGPALDIPYRASIVAEILARRAAWERREPGLCRDPSTQPGSLPVVEPRPTRIPPGPIERHGERAWFASITAAAIAVPVTRSFTHASAVLSAGLPKAARMGRETFVAHLGRALAGRDVLVLNPEALHVLDRVDILVLEAEVLRSEDLQMLGEIVPVADVTLEQIEQRVAALFDPERPRELRREADWVLGPIAETGHEPTAATRARARDLKHGSSPVLALVHRDTTVAIVQARRGPSIAAQRLLATARELGLHVAIAGPDPADADDQHVDRILPDGASLGEAVRELQRLGHVVCVVAARDLSALAAADLGVGMCRPDLPPPWVADLLCRQELGDVVLVPEACAAAREVSEGSVQLATAGAAVGGFFVLRGAPNSPALALASVNLAALAALGLGAWKGSLVGRRPAIPGVNHVPWHIFSTQRVLEHLDTSGQGLSSAEAQRRRVVPRPTPSSPLLLGKAVLEELNNPLTPVLLGGAGLSVAVGSAGDAAMIAGVVVLNGIIGGLQRFQTDRAIATLSRTGVHPVRVRRDEAATEVEPAELVPGDVIELEAGDVVAADCRILQAAGLEADEASLTGESLPVSKSAEPSLAVALAERSSMLFEGTFVSAGRATAVVVAVGAATEARRALDVARDERSKTGVEARLDALTRLAIPASLLGSLGLIGIGLLRGQPFAAAARSGVSLAAAAVPEGLPLLATAAQLASAQRLSARGALARDPRAIEALGRITMLCADKTGTLTQGRLTLRAVSDGSVEEHLNDLGPFGRHVLAAALRATPADQRIDALPHPTDQVIVEAARAAGVTVDAGAGGWRRTDELPFEPARAFHATLGSIPDGGGLLSVKGAPEVLLPRCSDARDAHGHASPLDPSDRRRLGQQVDHLARRGYRILAVAEANLPDDPQLSDELVRDLIFTGFLLISDPVRPAAAAAVDSLRRAGVETTMITGDHPSTAEGIAAELGLLNGYDIATGPQIDVLDDDRLAELLATVRVFARVTPAHKVRIVQGFQRLGHVVGMTGDGANDAPAIRLAEAGIALGERATTAARDAADLVVLDDRIETIVDAIVEGRAMWASVREAVAVLVGGNLGEIAFTVGASLIDGAAPLNPRQLLLVNLVTDVVPAMAIALRPSKRPAPQDLLHEGPDASLGQALNHTILTRALATTAGAGGAWLIGRVSGRNGRASTMSLVALVFTQLGQTLVVGARSPVVVAASLGSAALLTGIVQTPVVSHFFGCRPLGPGAWLTAVGAATGATGASVLLPRLVSRKDVEVPAAINPRGSPSEAG